MNSSITVRTSEPGWLAKLAKAYKQRDSTLIVDDANVGFDPAVDSLFGMARTAKLSIGEVAGALVACGMATAGVSFVVLAFLDPEPTSKLALLVGGGLTLAVTGGGSAIHVFTKKQPPSVKVSCSGIEISWT